MWQRREADAEQPTLLEWHADVGECALCCGMVMCKLCAEASVALVRRGWTVAQALARGRRRRRPRAQRHRTRVARGRSMWPATRDADHNKHLQVTPPGSGNVHTPSTTQATGESPFPSECSAPPASTPSTYSWRLLLPTTLFFPRHSLGARTLPAGHRHSEPYASADRAPAQSRKKVSLPPMGRHLSGKRACFALTLRCPRHEHTSHCWAHISSPPRQPEQRHDTASTAAALALGRSSVEATPVAIASLAVEMLCWWAYRGHSTRFLSSRTS